MYLLLSHTLNIGLEMCGDQNKKIFDECTISQRYIEKWKMRHHSAAVPDYCVRADNKLRPRVPLVIGDVVVRLKPDPLLTFSQKTIVARLPFAILHH